MIVGIGVDLTPIERMARAMDKHPERLEARLFTEGERAYCRKKGEPMQHFAARFAAKEAILKALAVPEGLSWHELEIVSSDGGAPRISLTGRAAQAAAAAGVRKLHLSLTHAGGQAMAFVIAEG